jgi:putative membrane-bound dehydrogenase-like protein
MDSAWHPTGRAVVASIAILTLLALVAGTLIRPAHAEEVRETPLTPEQELATFELNDKRLTIELVAAEPRLDSPVAISWDADGRLYVAEMIDYPLGPTAGRIRLLEDRDGNGRYERDSVFAEGLNFPNGVLAAQGGVFVTAAPDLLFFKDTNGDGKADEKRVVFSGFAEGNQQLRANGLTWGLDNWIYGANGRSDGNVRRPQDPIERAVSIRARDFRFRPDGSQFEATSGQSQFGQAGDDWGNRFLSWNTIPIRQAVFDQAFLDRNPRLSVYGVRDIADPADTGQVFPISPRPQTFNRERTDYFNALCGLTIYRGDALGDDYAGSAFVGESLTNLVHRRALSPAGPTFVSRRGEHGREFLASTDSWFHPVYMSTGPDGALYVVDFYRRWVEHPAFVAESLRQGVDWRKGSGHGRIWKVSRPDRAWPPSPPPRMTSESTAEVVKHIESPNGWRRDTAQRVLVERRDSQALAPLRAIVRQSRLAKARVQALATLDGLSALEDSTLLRALDDAESHVRASAVRLAAPRLAGSLELRKAVLAMARLRDSLVRFQVALALGSLETAEKLPGLVVLAQHEAADPWIPLAVVGSTGQLADRFLAELLRVDPAWQRNPNAAQIRLLREMAVTIGAAHDGNSPASILPVNTNPVRPGDLAMIAGAAEGFEGRGRSWRKAFDPPNPVLTTAREMAADERASMDYRLLAVDVLGLLDSHSGTVLLELLNPRHPQALQSAAAGALSHADADTAEKMFSFWSTLTTTTRRALVAAALRSAPATAALVAALEEQRIVPQELEPALRDALRAVRDPALQSRIKPLFKDDATAGNRQQVVAKFQAVLKLAGDRHRGAAVFEKHCLTCHPMQGRGRRVGPDLSGIGDRPKETLLVELFDPSRQVSADFVSYTLVTRQGQVLTGLVVAETATSVTLRRVEGAQDTVLRAQIEELRGTGKSVMPEGMEQNLSAENVADLLEFLAHPDAQLFSAAK